MNQDRHICPMELANSFDKKWRKWIHNPEKILKPYIDQGMSVIDVGCGPGFFSLEMARIVGPAGSVFACDIQKEMLEILRSKIEGTELEDQIILHECDESSIGLTEQVDFAMAFYVMHEVVDQEQFFIEMKSLLKEDGQFLIAEPLFHVSKKNFTEMLETAQRVGFKQIEKPSIFFSMCAVLEK